MQSARALGDYLGDRAKNKLTAVAIRKAADGKLFDGGGLTLVKRGASGQWVYRYSHLGRRREMGLGPWPDLSLADARSSRDTWASVLASGRDPIDVRRDENAAASAERDRDDPSFAKATDIVFEAIKDTLRGGGTRGRWKSPLDQHVIPTLGKKRMSEIHQQDIRDTLKPIWRKMHPTAKKAIERIGRVFNEMEAMGYDCNPRVVRQARAMLGHVNHKPVPTPSTHWQDIPALYEKLNTGSSVDQALRFLILTCVRGSAGVGAKFDEVDGDVWTVPADRVKGTEGKVQDFRVPLVAEAISVIDAQRAFCERYIFQSYTGRPVSLNALEKRLNSLKEDGRPHGFRASFRTWASDTDACGWEVSETILGHTIGTKVERSYDRSDLLDRRRIAMEAWADHVTGKASATVVSLR